jgi:3-oxoacyl-[acyl-carrier-protein] synthase II
MLGGAGAIEAATTALELYHSYIHRTINIFNQDPECDLDYVRDGARDQSVDYALSNSFGFGGHNASLLLSRYQNSRG